MNRVLPARRWIALGLLLAACAAPALRQSHEQPRQSADASAFIFVSPNTRDDLDLITAQQRIDTPDHARFRRLAGATLSELGVRRHRVADAVGEWQGCAENSLFVSIHEPVEPATVACAAAWFGLAARQKTVLAFRVGGGDHVVAVIEMPGQTLAGARELLDRHGFAERTLIARPDGWRAVVLVEGRYRKALERVPGARVRSGTAVTITRERYREVIRSYHANCELPLAKLGW
jgi:hypothetical protein